jgi:hypothetical protein
MLVGAAGRDAAAADAVLLPSFELDMGAAIDGFFFFFGYAIRRVGGKRKRMEMNAEM